MSFTGPIADRLAIRELYDSFADGAVRMDKASWLSCFAEDGHWSSPYFAVDGHEAIAATYDVIMAGVVDTTMSIQIGAIEVNGDTARCRNFQAESLLYPDGSTYELTGSYDDVIERRNGEWRFVRKPYVLKRQTLPMPAPGGTFSGPFMDRLAIRELHSTYADAASRMDKAQWLDCWAEDAVWDSAAGIIAGKAELSRQWDRLFTTMDALAFYSMTGAIAVSGDRATARDHVREIARIDGEVRQFSARYDDELVRVDGAWRFARRTYVLNIAG